jgi:hypothetical protein
VAWLACCFCLLVRSLSSHPMSHPMPIPSTPVHAHPVVDLKVRRVALQGQDPIRTAPADSVTRAYRGYVCIYPFFCKPRPAGLSLRIASPAS